MARHRKVRHHYTRDSYLRLGESGKKRRADKRRHAKRPGKRRSKSGKLYYETRPNRSDVNRRIKL